MDDHEELKRKVAFLDEIEGEDTQDESNTAQLNLPISRKNNGLSPAQKFLLAILVFFLVLVFGFFIMLITGKMVLPL
jgi:hypothetical protein